MGMDYFNSIGIKTIIINIERITIKMIVHNLRSHIWPVQYLDKISILLEMV